IDVDDDWHAARLGDDAGVIGNLVLLGRDQQDFHRTVRAFGRARIQNLIVEIDVLNVEWDVLFGLPDDRLGELGIGHYRQVDLLDDHRVTRKGCGDILGRELVAFEQAANRIAYSRPAVHRPLADVVWRNSA